MEASTIAKIGSDDSLVRQEFFWSVPGSKLFGNHADLKDDDKLRALLCDALEQQPSIVFAFLGQRNSWAPAEVASLINDVNEMADSDHCRIDTSDIVSADITWDNSRPVHERESHP